MELLFSIIAPKVMEMVMQVVAEVLKTIIDELWKHLSTMLVVG